MNKNKFERKEKKKERKIIVSNKSSNLQMLEIEAKKNK